VSNLKGKYMSESRNMKIDLQGHKVLVTGASRGIGKEIARMLGAAGAQVGIHYHNNGAAAHALAEEIGNQACVFHANLQDPQASVKLIQHVLEEFGTVDTLVNNAGIGIPIKEEDGLENFMEVWQNTLQVNLVASALLCRELIPQFSKQGGGRFVHIASRAAFRGDTPEYMAYAASKGGLVAYSRSLARGYGKAGIKSFVVAPGFTRTDMAQDFIDAYGEDFVRSDLALNELTEPKDIAPTVLFLASGFMDHATGCSIDINAGSYVR